MLALYAFAQHDALTLHPRSARTHLGVDPGGRELVLEHHDDDAEHAHDERVVADPLPLLEERLAPPQAVGQAVAARVVVAPAGGGEIRLNERS